MGLTRSEVADWLLQEQFLLTALEFHTELLESGTELQLLCAYFSNPANFETDTVKYCASPQSMIGHGEASFEFAPNSNVGEDDVIKQKDQKIALLEFEIRQMKEQMKVLRSRATTSLTDSQDASSELPGVDPIQPPSNQNTPNPSESIPAPARPNTPPPPPVIVTPAADGGVLVGNENTSPLEKRAINFICNHYLQQCGYKLTAITFADENEDQDFEDWEDVGLAMAQPPSLLHFYRTYYAQLRAPPSPTPTEIQKSDQQKGESAHPGSSLSRKDSKGEGVATTAIKREDSIGFRRTESEARRVDLSSEIEQDLSSTRQRLEALKRNNEELRSENETLKSKVHVLEEEVQSVATTRRNRKSTESLDDDSFDPLTLQRQFSLGTSLQRPNAFRRAVERVLIHGSTKNRLAQEVLHIKQHKDDAVEVLARSLPNIVPHVLLNKREELLPVILVTIMRHKDAKVRDRLTHMLFNLIKRPDEIQRRVIITGSMALAEGIGPTRCEAELMPQCWEQITHKFPERRTLVAEACGVLARYLKVELRSSLTLSILQQLTEDSNDLVRQAAVKNMGLLVSYVQDAQKYPQVEDLLLRALTDRSDRVVRAAQAYMLPSLAQWACELRTFQASLVPNIIKETLHQLEKGKITATSGLVDVYTLCCQLEALLLLVPFVYATLLRTAPFSAIEDVDPSGVGDDSLLSVQDFADAAAEEPSWMESLGGGTVEEDSGDDQDGLPPMASAPAWMEAGHRRNHSVDSRRSYEVASGNTSPQTTRKTQQQNALKFQRRKSELRHADNPLYSLTTLLGDEAKQRVLRQSLDDFLGIYSQAANTPQVHDVTWDTFTWVKTEWLPGLVQIVSHVPPSSAEGVALCSRLIFTVCRSFGPVFAEVIVRPLFTVIFDGSSSEAAGPEGAALRLHLLPVYVNGLLRAGGEDAWKDVVACIQEMVINMSLEQKHWTRDGLSTITLICTEFCEEEEGAVDHLMAVIWELVCHQSSAVRAGLAYVFTAVVPLASVSLLKDRLVPAFITLSNDTDIDVRNTVVPCFGMVLEHCADRGVVDKVKMQLQNLCEGDDENAERTMCVVVRTLGAVLAKVEPALRDDFILPRLYHIASRLANRPHSASNKMTSSALVRAFQSAMNCYIKSPVMRDVLHPGLLALLRCSAHLSLAEQQTVETLARQCETKFDDKRDSVSTIGSAAASTRERILGLFHKDEDKEDRTSGTSSNALAGMFRRNPNMGPR